MEPERLKQNSEPEYFFRQSLDDFRRHGKQVNPLQNFLAPLAALILLRWVSIYESGLESLGGQHKSRFLQGEFNWKSWSQLRGNQLWDFLQQFGLFLDSLPETGWGTCLRVISRHIEIEALPEKTLDSLIDWVDKVPLKTLEDRQILGEVFTRIIQEFIKEQKYSGEFFTPSSIVELMVELASPKPGEWIYDPCFGTGGLLVASADKLRQQIQENWSESQNKRFFGVEVNPFLYIIGMARAMLAGIDNPQLELGNTLERSTEIISLLRTTTRRSTSSEKVSPALQRPQKTKVANPETSKKFDCIIAVPPFGARVTGKVAELFPLKSYNSETLFLQHIMASLKPSGRAVVLVPDRFLFSGGAERRVRETLLKNYRVEGVISVPQIAFTPYTTIKTSILLFSLKKPLDSVRFHEVSRIIKPKEESTKQTFKLVNQILTAPDSITQVKASKKYKDSRTWYPYETAQEFQAGKLSEHLWETPIKKLAEYNWRLVPKRIEEDVLEEFLQEIKSEEPNISIKRLDEVAKIFIGISNQSTPDILILKKNQSENFIRIIKAGDIDDFRINLPSKGIYINSQLEEKVNRYRLQLYDLLIPRLQSLEQPIKIGVVSPQLVGSIPTNNLVVIRITSNTQLSSAYLATLLRIPIYQAWLKNYASQLRNIARFSIKELHKLPIPIPPLPVQESITRRNWESTLDATKLLLGILTQQDPDPIAVWLEAEPLVHDVLLTSRSTDKQDNLTLLLNATNTIVKIRNNLVHRSGRTADPIFINWFLKVANALFGLKDFSDIPEGTARIVVLNSVKNSLTKLILIRKNNIQDSSLVQRAKDFTNSLIKLIEQQIHKQITDIRVEAKLTPPIITVGKETEIILTLHNKGVIPIRQVSILTNPDLGKATTPYLAEGMLIDVPLVVLAQNTEEMLNFVVSWSGKLLNGEPIQREIPLSIKITSPKQKSNNVVIVKPEAVVINVSMTGQMLLYEKELGASPYIVGNPVDREEMFFGRSKVIEKIQLQLATSNKANVILLEGNRRTGKTSILRYLQIKEKLPDWIVVECSFQEGNGDRNKVGLPTKEVFRLMAEKIGKAAYKEDIDVQLPGKAVFERNTRFKFKFMQALRQYFSEDHPFEDFQLFLQSVLDAASPRRVLLMLDEFDKLQEGIDSGVTSSQVPENIRYLFQSYSNLSGIITGSRRLKRLREEYWSALFGLGYRIGLDPLEPDDARQLVTNPVESRLVYVPQARDLVVDLCACQPFLIQSLCNRIFERATLNNERSITLEFVRATIDDMVHDNEHFRTLWDYAGTERRRYILSLCHQLRQKPDPLTFQFLETKLYEAEIPVDRKKLAEDIEFLIELELIELDLTETFHVYKLTIPLMGNWISKNVDPEDLRRKAKEEGQDEFL